MKKLLVLIVMVLGFGASAMAQETSPYVYVAWSGKGDGCYCPLAMCLEVCWCDSIPGGGCIPGSEQCNLDCIGTLQPGDRIQYDTLNVNVPPGKHIIMKVMHFTFACQPPVSFDFNLLLPDGFYTFPPIKPGCPPVTIDWHSGFLKFFTGN